MQAPGFDRYARRHWLAVPAKVRLRFHSVAFENEYQPTMRHPAGLAIRARADTSKVVPMTERSKERIYAMPRSKHASRASCRTGPRERWICRKYRPIVARHLW
jgi:hypothetical protein